MRWIFCALFLLAVPSLASAALDFTITSPLDNKTATSSTVSGLLSGVMGTATVSVQGATGAPVTAVVNGNSFTAVNVPFVLGPNAISVTANDDAGNPVTKSTTGVTTKLVVNFTTPDPGTQSLTTQNGGVQTAGQVEVSDPNGIEDPNFVFALRGIATKLADDGTFGGKSGFVKLGAGDSTIIAGATDTAGNSFTTQFAVTRTVICDDTTDNPTVDPNDPNTSRSYSVNRADDLPNGDPNSITCDVRIPTIPPPPASDPNQPFTPPIGHCTLRAAIQASNAHHAAHPLAPIDSIFMGSRRIILRRHGAHEDRSATGDLDIRGAIQIIGNARDASVIDGRELNDRIFDVPPGATLKLFDLTVANGKTPKQGTGAVDPNDPNNVEAEVGGCVRSGGTLSGNAVAMLSCSADDDGGDLAVLAGSAKFTCAIFARGKSKAAGGGIVLRPTTTLELRNSTVSLNSATFGGAIASASDSVILTNDTFTNNTAKTRGGALDVSPTDDPNEAVVTTVNNCTFSGNKAKTGSSFGGALSLVRVSNSILGDTGKLGCDPNSPVLLTGGGNIELGDACLEPTNDPDDLFDTNPQLSKLATNEATAPTQQLLPTSPAIDFAGKQTACEPLDARDTLRFDWPGVGTPDDPNALTPFCDSGAFELTAPSLP